MTTILQINTSLFGENGQSSKLAAEFAAALAASSGGNVQVRDLARNPLPHLTAEDLYRQLLATVDGLGRRFRNRLDNIRLQELDEQNLIPTAALLLALLP